jgi:hypothetical protein
VSGGDLIRGIRTGTRWAATGLVLLVVTLAGATLCAFLLAGCTCRNSTGDCNVRPATPSPSPSFTLQTGRG